MSGYRWIVDILGRILIGAGVVLLLFTGYQIWGTSIQESHTQSALRSELHQSASSSAQASRALSAGASRDAPPTGPPVTAPVRPAPPEGAPIGEIRIPVIGLDQVVVEGTSTADLRKGPGHYVGTPLPGQPGNAAVAGHRTTYGHPFYSLDAVKVGDPVVLTTLQGQFVYDVTKSFVVSPSDTAVLADSAGNTLTLTTCNPRFSASTRLIVQATLAHSRLFATTTKLPPANEGQGQSATPAPAPAQSAGLAGDSTVEWAATIGWGLALVVLAGLVFAGAQRYFRYRWYIYGGGATLALILLWFFFGAVSPLLPASF